MQELRPGWSQGGLKAEAVGSESLTDLTRGQERDCKGCSPQSGCHGAQDKGGFIRILKSQGTQAPGVWKAGLTTCLCLDQAGS